MVKLSFRMGRKVEEGKVEKNWMNCVPFEAHHLNLEYEISEGLSEAKSGDRKYV